MANRFMIGLAAFGTLAVVASFFWFGISTTEVNDDHHRAVRDMRKKTQAARLIQLRRTLRHLAQKESREEKADRQRFQSILSSVLGDTAAIVVNARKLKNTHLADRMLACLASTQQSNLARAQKEWGIDLLTDVRRIAFAKELVLITGHVASAEKTAVPLNIPWENYGSQGKVFDAERIPGSGRPNAGMWRDKLFMVADLFPLKTKPIFES